MTSANLLARFVRTNDCNVLMELYNRHHDKLIQWIRSHYAVDSSIAENVVIAAFEQARDGCYDGESFDNWLCTLAGNCVAAVTARIEGLRWSAALTESRLESLPLVQQQALTVFFLYDLSDDLAADALGVTAAEFREIVQNALTALDSEYQPMAA